MRMAQIKRGWQPAVWRLRATAVVRSVLLSAALLFICWW